jgi:uncharacterized repeat protein (TIGR01451 family)
MQRSVHINSMKRATLLAAALASVGLIGCDSTRSSARMAHNDTQNQSRERAQASRTAYGQMDGDTVSSTVAYPTGDRDDSVLLIEKTGPKQVRVGQPFTYNIKVTNITDRPLENVVVHNHVPEGDFARRWDADNRWQRDGTQERAHRLTGGEGEHPYYPPIEDDVRSDSGKQRQADRTNRERRQRSDRDRRGMEPVPAEAADLGGELRIGRLAPGESETVEVAGHAGETGALRSCTYATYTPVACMMTRVVSPELRVERQVPDQVAVCEDAEVTYRVRNVGTGTARNFTIREELPEGVRTADGSRTVRRNVNALPAGESREFTVPVNVEQTGTYAGYATIRNEDGPTAESSESSFVARKPNLDLSVSVPDQAFHGHSLDYSINVSNTGDMEARELVVRQTFEQSVEVVSASNNGRIDGDTIVWRLNPLATDDKVRLSSTVTAPDSGRLRSTVVADAYCAQEAEKERSRSVRTRLSGLTSLLLEVVDNNDPVQRGNNETYEICVTNQGSEADTNIQLTAMLPEEMKYVTSSGQAKTRVRDREITFTIDRLEPKESVEMSLIARATGEGDVRFELEMTSEKLTKPVMETEATKLY